MTAYVGGNKIKDTGAYGVYFCPGKTNCLTYTPKNVNLTLDPLNVTIVGSPTINNGVASGFSSANHIRLPKAFNPGTNSWEVVVKFTMGSSSSNNQVIFESTNGGGARAISIYFGHSSKKLVYCISGDTATNNILSDVAGTNTITYSTTYWVKLSFNGSSYVSQISTNGTSWVNDITKSSSVTIYSATTGLFGYFPPDANTYCFSGSIDLPNSYIKINGSTWWKGGTGALTLKKGSKVYVPNGYDINAGIVGSPTINNGVVSGFSASNYLLTQNSVNLNSVNNFEIVVRSQYNTGSLLQQHSNAPYTIALRADLMLVRLSGDSGWTTVYNNTTGLITGNWYSFRASFDGSTYKFERAEDGGEYVVLATLKNSTKIISNNQPFVLGTNDVHTDPYLGSIDLTQSYIKINGELWWQGKAGSGKPKFDEVVVGSDLSLIQHYDDNDMVALVFIRPNGIQYLGTAFKGSTLTSRPTSVGDYKLHYISGENKIFWDAPGEENSLFTLPIAIVDRSASNGFTSIDQIFDWCGYIGSTAFVLPKVKGLVPNGFNVDGTYKNIEFEIPNVSTMDYSTHPTCNCNMYLYPTGLAGWIDTDDYRQETYPGGEYNHLYIPSKNEYWYNETGGYMRAMDCLCGTLTVASGVITSLTPYSVKTTNDLQAINAIYNGSQKVYQFIPSNTVFFETATPGTYTFTAPRSCTVSIIMVGAGGGAAYAHGGYWESTANGGSAGMITGTMNITKGTSYSIVVGAGGGGVAYEGNDRVYAGAGGATTFAGQTAGGGGGANAQNTGGANAGTAGVATITISTLNASNGVAGSTASRYGSYGGGGVSRNGAGQGGYIRIAVA